MYATGSRLAVLLILLLFGAVRAQQYSFINYSIEDGLAQSQVLSIFQDKKGYLWFGTYGGLTRYDGKNFVNFSKEDGLLDNRINSIAQDKNDQVWVATQGGICRFDGKSFKSFPLAGELAQNQVTSIAVDRDGKLWLGTYGAGVCRFDGTHFTYFTQKNGLVNDYVRSVSVSPGGRVWFGTRNGTCFYEGGSIRTLDTSLAQPRNISQVMTDSKGNTWFCTYGDGVFRLGGDGAFVHLREADGLINDWIRWVEEDRWGNLWFASKKGVSKYNGSSFLNFTEANGLFYANSNTILEDREGNLWFGTDAKGVLRFTGETFVSYTTSEGLGSDIVMSFNEDKDRNLWFCTYGSGVCRYDGKSFTTFTNKDGLINNTVWTGITSRNGHLLFGTAEGVSKYDGRSFTNYATETDLGANTVYSLLEDRKGRMWIGTTAGVSVFDGTSFNNYNNGREGVGKVVKALLEDRAGAIWIGSGSGLCRYDGSAFRQFTVADGLNDNNVVSLLEDRKGTIWAGTINGLARYDGKKFVQVTIDKRYNSNYINFLLADRTGNLWVGTNNGIYELDAGTPDGPFRHYSNYEGMRSLECNQNAAYQDAAGNLWFGTAEGVLKYSNRPLGNEAVPLEPLTHITGVRLFLQPTDWTKYSDTTDPVSGLPVGLKVNYKKNYFTFDYIGIHLNNPGEVKYKFILEGFDEDWSPPTDATFATYSNLPYGKYTFKVIAGSKNGNWNETPVVFRFEITPPFWMTWWFYLLCFVLTTAMVWLIYRWRVSVLKRKHETQQLEYKSKLLALEQQSLNASMNRHFIFNALNSIQYYINKQDKLAANKYLTSFAKLIRKNLDSSQSNLVPLAEEMERLKLYLELEHMRFENKFSYQISIDKEVDTEGIEIPPMLLQPFVENSIWHGILPLEKPGLISIAVKQGPGNNITFVIEDNGIGIEKSLKNKEKNGQLHISRGMEITSGRINLLKAMNNSNISIKGPFDLKNGSNSASGTRVEIVLPLKNYF